MAVKVAQLDLIVTVFQFVSLDPVHLVLYMTKIVVTMIHI